MNNEGYCTYNLDMLVPYDIAGVKKGMQDAFTSGAEIPLSLMVIDLPNFHRYGSQISEEFFKELAETEFLDIFLNPCIKYIINEKWPLAKKVIERKLFYPYIVY
jgi:hypothetical protein